MSWSFDDWMGGDPLCGLLGRGIHWWYVCCHLQGFSGSPSFGVHESLAQQIVGELGHRDVAGLGLVIKDRDEKPGEGRRIMTVSCHLDLNVGKGSASAGCFSLALLVQCIIPAIYSQERAGRSVTVESYSSSRLTSSIYPSSFSLDERYSDSGLLRCVSAFIGLFVRIYIDFDCVVGAF